jgi:hypothetical protein
VATVAKSRKASPDDLGSVIGEDVRASIYKSTRAKVEAIWYASLDGDVERVKEILAEGNHDVNGLNRWQTDSDPNGWQRTPLHAAALKDHLKLAEFLLSEGADANSLTKYKDAPLHFAVTQGDVKMVRLLLDHGARPDAKNDDGDTPIDIAKKEGDSEVLQMLAKAGTK